MATWRFFALIGWFAMAAVLACAGGQATSPVLLTPTPIPAGEVPSPVTPATLTPTPLPRLTLPSATAAAGPTPAIPTAAAPQLAQITLLTVRDNTLYQDAAGALSNGAGQHLFAGMNNSGAVYRAVVAFDVAERIPPGSRITTVTLSLNLSRTVSGPQKVQLHRLLADWGEGDSDAPANEGGGIFATPGGATWLHRFYLQETWKTAGGDFSEAASAESEVADPGAYTWGSTPQMVADVQDWLDRPAVNFGWLLRGNESKSQTAKRFDSRENENEANRPLLRVEYLSSGRPTSTPTSKLPAAPTTVISQTSTLTPAPVSTLPPSTARQELAEIENYSASRFYPDRFVVLEGTPLRLYITRLHREHVNRFTIEPFVRSTAFFPPGTMGFIEFTPDRAGEFRVRNVGHGYEAALVVVEGGAGLRDYWAGRRLQEFALIHDFTASQVAPQRLEAQQNIPVRIFSTGLGGQDKVSIPPFYMATAVNVEQGKIAVFEFTPTVAGEFPIVYEQHNLAGTLVVRARP